jgi:hypothetical protein
MASFQAIQQLARILGREEFARSLDLPAGQLPPSLTAEQVDALHSLAEEHIEDLVRAMLSEAAACDDLTNAASALAYLDDRLATFGELLTDEQKESVRARFQEYASKWE